MKQALLAGGCFWGMEELFRRQPGVVSTRVGYSGGTLENPTYKDICTGKTGHAEAIEIIYEENETDFRDILIFFFKMHDPTTKDRQGNDRGTQYRSAIFYLDEEQKNKAGQVIREINKAGVLPAPIVTEVTKAGPFYEAEPEHQDYLEKHPGGYTCHFVRNDWDLDKVKQSA